MADRTITTIEAIGETPSGRKVQQAWLDVEVIQCGYCQSGQIMSAAADEANKHREGDQREWIQLFHDFRASFEGQALTLHARFVQNVETARDVLIDITR